MNYRQLQQALKSYRDQGYTVPKLNSKKAILESALDEIEQLRAGEAPPSKEYMKALKAVAELNALYRECDKRGFDVEALLAEDEKSEKLFWESLSCTIPLLAA